MRRNKCSKKVKEKYIVSHLGSIYLPVCLSTVKNFSPSSTLYTTLALLPYVGSSASDAVTFITDVPVKKRELHLKKARGTKKNKKNNLQRREVLKEYSWN